MIRDSRLRRQGALEGFFFNSLMVFVKPEITVENNLLGATSSDKLDKAVEKIKNGDKSLATANELIKLENADK
ncbi:hypothetical protein JMY81_17920, partial [Brenneria goodwinii]|nr:hypothetical protein [Brenneria goodwinii]MCG8162675.1 hypothetical protein [Brenneria goodwinii]MCG8168269.1 hypothetical protein [Brenneria goodwinii]MCG8172919.1 hypothetical protein [Brenneria goodwinii]MCG8176696.1 hypothetical protein [Brenneria goodwinii]